METREKQLGSKEPPLLRQVSKPFAEGFLRRSSRFGSHALGYDLQGPSAPFIALGSHGILRHPQVVFTHMGITCGEQDADVGRDSTQHQLADA
jgi:hypothetical protein